MFEQLLMLGASLFGRSRETYANNYGRNEKVVNEGFGYKRLESGVVLYDPAKRGAPAREYNEQQAKKRWEDYEADYRRRTTTGNAVTVDQFRNRRQTMQVSTTFNQGVSGLSQGRAGPIRFR